MALVICPECNKEISDSVKKCPHCGYKLKKEKKEKAPKILTTPKRKKSKWVLYARNLRNKRRMLT